jgi:hypothetical protein
MVGNQAVAVEGEGELAAGLLEECVEGIKGGGREEELAVVDRRVTWWRAWA